MRTILDVDVENWKMCTKKAEEKALVVDEVWAIANVQIKSIIWNMQPKISFTDKIWAAPEPLHLQ